MFFGHDDELFELAVHCAWLDADKLTQIANANPAGGSTFCARLIAASVPRDRILHDIAVHLGFVLLPTLPDRLSGDALALIDGELARRCGALPLGERDGCALVAVEDPFDSAKHAAVSFALSGRVIFAVADPEKIRWLLHLHFGTGLRTGPSLMASRSTDENFPAMAADASAADDSGAAVEWVDAMLERSVRAKASDLHLEPCDGALRLRVRVDGTLHDLPSPPAQLAAAVTSRLKVLANLDIAERRVPQDGRIARVVAGQGIDFRVSTLPAQSGESLVLRVLDKSSQQLDLASLGMPVPMEGRLRAAIRRPGGIVIVTGPTGSGKTTTLYGCLRELNAPDTKVLTIEDPVEYEIEGVMQTSINAAAELDFAAGLKAFLRQDPDVIMIGEIRDSETARVAIQAALTGHLVLTTLHTNDAVGAVTRLVDMGIEPFLITSTVEVVVAQRLLRRSCERCGGVGCTGCHRGFSGRLGIFELVRMTEELREAVNAREPLARLQRIAAGQGASLRGAALDAVARGRTTLAEVNRHL